jgi:glycosyltransferase involved in cell wall biosynthesis
LSQLGVRRRVLASAVAEERLDLLVHALAQLPDEIRLDLPNDTPCMRSLATLAESYGVGDRVRFTRTPAKGETAVVSAPGEGSTQETLGEFVEGLYGADDPPASCRTDDRLLAGHRIAIVTNIPMHYRTPLFNQLSVRLAQSDASLRVLLQAAARPSRAWMNPGRLDFDHQVLRTFERSVAGSRFAIPINLERHLAQFSPTVVLSGGFSPAVSGRVARFCASRKIPFGIWSGELASRPTAQTSLRRRQRRWIVNRASFGVAYGFLSGEYLRSLRPDLPLILGRNTAPASTEDRSPSRSSVIEILAVSRALPEKALDMAVDAVQLLDEYPPWRLTVVGDGPELTALQSRSSGDSRIRFLGAVSSDLILDLYRGSDIFVFPSRYDVFGLVQVEAMASGLATVLSNAPGVASDLCVSGHNCLLVSDADDPAAWASAIRSLLTQEELRVALGRNARRSISRRWTVAHSVDAMVAGFRLGIHTWADDHSDARFGRLRLTWPEC